MTAYTAADAHAAVARGAAWLDEECPRWFEEIDLGKLDLREPEVCVLGQTANCILGARDDDDENFAEPGYFRVLYSQSSDWATQDRWARICGFMAPTAQRVHYEMLTVAWKSYIRARLEALVPA